MAASAVYGAGHVVFLGRQLARRRRLGESRQQQYLRRLGRGRRHGQHADHERDPVGHPPGSRRRHDGAYCDPHHSERRRRLEGGSSHAITWTATDNVAVTSVDLAWSTTAAPRSATSSSTGDRQQRHLQLDRPECPHGHGPGARAGARCGRQRGRDSSAANFTISLWTIADGGPRRHVTPSGSVPVAQGGNAGFTITAVATYQIANVFVDALPVGAIGATHSPTCPPNHSWSRPSPTRRRPP